ncbi:hypothetical protein E4T39_01988 [Aureobasidium subglaciale]|nr:hypothetical protein E4T39_01988 [Aureobasidium subglaciale]
MKYSSSYYALWTQQTRLFIEIDQLKYHTADIERQLARNQRTLVNPESKRCDRRKANWVVNSQQKYLKELERTLQFLLQALSVCQAQIARIHDEASWQAEEYDISGHQYDASSLDGNPTPTQETFMYHIRFATPGSGVSEPVFPTAGDFTPAPRAATHKAISALAQPFTPFVFAKANPPSHSRPINSKPLFKQPVWASPLEWSEQVAAELTPVSPTSKIEQGEDGKEVKRRYSVAAIEFIESRLRHKRQISDTGWRVGVQG